MNNTTDRAKKPLSIDTLSDYLEKICFAHGKTINGPLLAYWKSTLVGLTEEEFLRGTYEHSISAKCEYWPQPGQIYRLARPEGDKQSEAQLVVERLFTTLGTCGENDSERARGKLPEIAWDYVQNLGGWGRFAREMQFVQGDAMAVKAQARNAIVALMDRKKSGKPMLLGNEKSAGLTSIADFKNLLPTFPEGDD